MLIDRPPTKGTIPILRATATAPASTASSSPASLPPSRARAAAAPPLLWPSPPTGTRGEQEDGAAAASRAVRPPERTRILRVLGRGRGGPGEAAPRPVRAHAVPPLSWESSTRCGWCPRLPSRGRRVRPHQDPPPRPRRQAGSQLRPGCSQHRVCGHANSIHIMELPGGRAAQIDHRCALHVHVPGDPGLLDPAAAAGGILGLWCGFPCRQRLLLPLLLGARRGLGDRHAGHEADEEAQLGVDV
ncbi:phosphatidylcholine:diacylglycerol cholinephosphotransferase 1-like [Iris pallida]|uniref:Phosphatidylcholine:diacylglycerol cholinephosphotransferase 1-like n=1 Tax=Iris pallida TaxID=29817 RepID=A0AAX6DWJ0_IRIPA|nr:phosphatidylcholine:diacylglycerol cholinephosphotransferase 1-like [Iris pallida]